MAEFLPAHQQTMGDEGGYANNPADHGGETYKGIARNFWPKWQGWKIIDRYKVQFPPPQYLGASFDLWVKVANRAFYADTTLQALVLDFYKANFWDANRLREIESQVVATWTYNHIVNAGARGAMWIQAAAGVTADGSIGPKTLAAINAAEPKALLARAMENAAAYRIERVRRDPTQRQFLHAWLARDGLPEPRIKEIMATV